MNRNKLENELSDLNLGELDTTGISDESLEAMIAELSEASINLETDAGVDTLKQIVEKYA